MKGPAVLALDLGTTAFKAAPVDADGLLAHAVSVPYRVDTGGGGAVTCPARRYRSTAWRALRAAAKAARERSVEITAIGISSQAQTYAPCDRDGSPLEEFTVWTDARATAGAKIATDALPDFAAISGFAQPDPLQLLPKLIERSRNGESRPPRFLQLPEWICQELTGHAVGDTMIQGMGGLFDISTGQWNQRSLEIAGVSPDQLPPLVAPGSAGHRLRPEIAAELGLPAGIPVVPCGNDQSCAAVGAGAVVDGPAFANFGTALVAIVLKREFIPPVDGHQIAGIGPLPGTWFLLGLEPECGNLIELLANLLHPRGGVGKLLEEAASTAPLEYPPTIQPTGGGRLDLLGIATGCTRGQLARATADHFARRFQHLLQGLAGAAPLPTNCLAGGGLSQSDAWRQIVHANTGISLDPAGGQHPGLVGIARIVAASAPADGAPFPQPPLEGIHPWNTASNT